MSERPNRTQGYLRKEEQLKLCQLANTYNLLYMLITRMRKLNEENTQEFKIILQRIWNYKTSIKNFRNNL